MARDGKIFGVSELNNVIKAMLDADQRLGSLYIRGEISNYKVYPSGHHYFTLKDAEGSLKCVMFRRQAAGLKFRPENGMKVIASGRVTVYVRDGVYQLYCTGMTPDGLGDLHVAFEQLKEKLWKEGLFDEAHKKPVPAFPENIAVITSPAGAAVRDIIRVAGKRWPMAKISVLPVRVQGEEAPGEIAEAIKYANKWHIGDVIITGRGGGSLEDLWAFNDERVARAIYASEIPVISAVGHEPDYTISDFTADLRAATPSNGAELCVPDREDIIGVLENAGSRINAAMGKKLSESVSRLEELKTRRVLTDPMSYIDDRRIALDYSRNSLSSAFEKQLNSKKQKYLYLTAALNAMSPLRVLARGYSIAETEAGEVIRTAEQVSPGDRIYVTASNVRIRCLAEEKEIIEHGQKKTEL